ncbi:MAG: hypothetical protein ACK5XN_21740 [Bacteroidota bacterium]|jgi:hypothetical protein
MSENKVSGLTVRIAKKGDMKEIRRLWADAKVRSAESFLDHTARRCTSVEHCCFIALSGQRAVGYAACTTDKSRVWVGVILVDVAESAKEVVSLLLTGIESLLGNGLSHVSVPCCEGTEMHSCVRANGYVGYGMSVEGEDGLTGGRMIGEVLIRFLP